MSGSEPEEVPKTQPALSGGPPEPPKKIARGMEDGWSGRGPGDAVERLIAEYARLLQDPKQSAADRAKLEECLKELQSQRPKRE